MEGVCVKHRVEENSIKMYDKQGSVLRVETTLNNPQRFRVYRGVRRKGRKVKGWYPLRKGIVDLRRRVQLSRGANARYLEALAVVGESRPAHRILDPVSQPLKTPRPYRALRPISPQESRLFAVLLRGEFHLQGVRNRDLREALSPSPPDRPRVTPSRRRSRHSPITLAACPWTHLPRGTNLLLPPHAERPRGYEYRPKIPPNRRRSAGGLKSLLKKQEFTGLQCRGLAPITPALAAGSKSINPALRQAIERMAEVHHMNLSPGPLRGSGPSSALSFSTAVRSVARSRRSRAASGEGPKVASSGSSRWRMTMGNT